MGPYLDNGLPDLRNLKLYYAECMPGDIVLILSDGVHDNIDPQSLGIPPHGLLSVDDINNFNFFGTTDEPAVSMPSPNVPEQVLTCDSWEEAESRFPKLADQAKTIFRQNMLLKLINELYVEKKHSFNTNTTNNNNSNNNNNNIYSGVVAEALAVTPKEITDKLIKYCRSITESSRQWMQQNPASKLPSDYVTYPGKMDHTTAITFRVTVVPPFAKQ